MNRKLFVQFVKIILSFCGMILYGCSVGPNFHPPAPPNTSRYTYSKLPKKTVSSPNSKSGNSQTFSYNTSIPAQWWHLFHSASLNFLIKQGIKHNQSLEAAKNALKVAEQTLRAQIGSLYFPALDLQLGAAKTRLVSFQYGADFPPSVFSIYNTKALASYDLDLFGKNRRTIEYYRASVDFKNYEMLAAYLSLTANITTTAITIASLEAQIRTTKELIKTQKKVLSIQQARLKYGGIATEDVYTQQTLLAQTIATLPPLQKSLTEENSALAVLTGSITSKSPPLHLQLDSLKLPSQLPVSLPSVLVEQRPDILSAEAMLHEMSAKIGVATAQFLPDITLSASYGWIAQAPAQLFLPLSNTWNLAAALLQPLFHGGALIAQRRAAIAEYKEYYAEYQNVVLKAFKNVSDALNAIQIDAHEFKARVTAQDYAQKTLTTALRRYDLGGQNYLTVMNAQQQYLQDKLNRIKAQAARFNDTAALFQALGGGWWVKIWANTTSIQNHSAET